VANGDATVIERILADDFVGVDPDGSFYNQAKMVADTREAPKYFVSNHLNEVKVRLSWGRCRCAGKRILGGCAAARTFRLDPYADPPQWKMANRRLKT
jgi:hypothetical protein